MRYLLALVLIAALVAGGVFVYAGRLPGPVVEIAKPTKYVGQSTPVEVEISTPGAKVDTITIAFEQNGRQTPLFSLASSGSSEVKQESVDKVRVSRMIDSEADTDINTGAPLLIVVV